MVRDEDVEAVEVLPEVGLIIVVVSSAFEVSSDVLAMELAGEYAYAGRDWVCEQVADIIVRNSVRVGDVASVYFGPADARTISRLNGYPVLGLEVIRLLRPVLGRAWDEGGF